MQRQTRDGAEQTTDRPSLRVGPGNGLAWFGHWAVPTWGIEQGLLGCGLHCGNEEMSEYQTAQSRAEVFSLEHALRP